jgi:phosphomevalonate kinase
LVRASEATRRARGWTFTLGIDDAETECGLDAVTDWNLVIDDDGDEAAVTRQLDVIVKWCSCSAMAKD